MPDLVPQIVDVIELLQFWNLFVREFESGSVVDILVDLFLALILLLSDLDGSIEGFFGSCVSIHELLIGLNILNELLHLLLLLKHSFFKVLYVSFSLGKSTFFGLLKLVLCVLDVLGQLVDSSLEWKTLKRFFLLSELGQHSLDPFKASFALAKLFLDLLALVKFLDELNVCVKS